MIQVKYFNSRDASKILNLSRERITQVLKPDKRAERPKGGAYECLYTQETIDNYKLQVVSDKKERIEKLIKNELYGITRPEGDYLTLTEAEQFLKEHFTKKIITDNVKHVNVLYLKKVRKFFLRENLLKLSKDAIAKKKTV